MSDRGVFAVDRGIFTDDLFADEPLTEREAWLWIIAEAAWKDRRARVGTALVDLRRGQLCHSVRFMAEAWFWSKSRVDRFLAKLEKRDAIARTSGTATSVITVCRYDEFQRVCLPTRDSDGTVAGTAAGQQRDKRESIKTLISPLSAEADIEQPAQEDPEPIPASQPTAKPKTKGIDQRLDQFEIFARAYPRKHTAFPTTMARKRWIEAMKRGEDSAAIIAGGKAYAAEQARAGNVGTRFVKSADSWLFQQLWRDYATPEPQAQAMDSGDDYLAGLTDERWRGDVRRWNRGLGNWLLRSHTPPPDHPDTKVPPRILAEFGLVPTGRREPEPTGAVH